MLRPEDNDTLIDEALHGTRFRDSGRTLYALIDDGLDAFAAAAHKLNTSSVSVSAGDTSSTGIRYTVTIEARS